MSTEIININNSARRDLFNKKDEVRGHRYIFGGTETPTEIRNRLKATGLKGNKLSSAVRDIRNGSKSLVFAQTHAFIELVQSKGHATTYADITDRGFTIKGTKIGTDKVKKSDTAAKVREEIIAKLIANTGATREQIEQTLLA